MHPPPDAEQLLMASVNSFLDAQNYHDHDSSALKFLILGTQLLETELRIQSDQLYTRS